LSYAHAGRGLVVAVSVSVSACSADVTRFDFPAFNLAESNGSTGALPGPPPPRGGQAFDGPSGAPPQGVGAMLEPMAAPAHAGSSGQHGERVASRDYAAQNMPLPPIVPEHRPATVPASLPERYPQAGYDRGERPRSPAASRGAGEPQRAAPSSDSIAIEPGDTLYAISKRYGVSLADLIETNRLHHGTALKPGQQLLLPAGAVARRARREARATPAATVVPENSLPVTNVPVTKVAVTKVPVTKIAVTSPAVDASAAAVPAADAAAPPAAAWQARHTIKAGDSLYGIARQHRVTLAELQRVNGITNPLRVKIGTTLLVPGTAAGPLESGPQAVQDPPATPKIINAERKVVAARSDQMSDAEAISPAGAAALTSQELSSGRFRWPARGRIIAGFGRRPDGTHNDGINLALPQGTDVHAAEAGKVAYAGNELKGYGNLILIRHDNGWVSAYAHNEQLLVKRDDTIRRGQVIAKAGKTGTVDQPQLHFELRQGSKPVDPLMHLEKN
jgi:murein DD-endopeptidase MepM/ murein hydrolase activator NlpD